MKITAHLQAALPGVPETIASVSGDALTVDGTVYDLSAVPEGGEAWPEGDHPFSGPITRTGGEIACAVAWAYDPATAEDHQGPTHPVMTIASGPVPDPVTRKQEAQQ
ncbi:hypothetical protein [Ponticoccus litoralis]|uniref:Uncharacterized protein n=1 Tax=Ponticoccus litoralis TaxID=422297 RepID=A0AAW9SDA8_9RHOB